jgi:hypothetical protein
MTPLLDWLSSPALAGLVEALLHSLWLGAVAAAGSAALLFVIPFGGGSGCL